MKIKKIVGIIALFLLTIIVSFFLWVAPYGKRHLPVWIEKGKPLVEVVETFRKENGYLPDELPIEPKIEGIPDCRQIVYRKNRDDSGKYRIYIQIHLREGVIYDSEQKYTEDDNWSAFTIKDGWAYTCD